MANPLSNVVLSGTTYSDAATITGIWGHPRNGQNGGGTYDVSGGSVFYQLLYNTTDPRAQPSGYALSDWGPEVLLRPSQGIIPAIAYGIRFRNVDATIPATVNAYIAPPGQPALTINSTNDVSATVASTTVTGHINANGTIAAGTGFSVNHTGGTGIYVVTFTNAYSAPPNIQVTLVTANTGSNSAVANLVTGWTATSFTVRTIATATGTLTDLEFTFLAMPTV